MKPLTRNLLYWSPRVLTILFAIFISIFALDVFSSSRGFWETATGLLLHLIPTAFIIGVLVLAWRWEWIGAAIYLALAILYIVLARGRFPLSAYFVIAGPLVVVGALFMLNWLLRAQLRGNAGTNSVPS